MIVFTLVCDGCGRTADLVRALNELPSVRARLAGEGWRRVVLPTRVPKSQRITDLCPQCAAKSLVKAKPDPASPHVTIAAGIAGSGDSAGNHAVGTGWSQVPAAAHAGNGERRPPPRPARKCSADPAVTDDVAITTRRNRRWSQVKE
jgi:hypothetical protein